MGLHKLCCSVDYVSDPVVVRVNVPSSAGAPMSGEAITIAQAEDSVTQPGHPAMSTVSDLTAGK